MLKREWKFQKSMVKKIPNFPLVGKERSVPPPPDQHPALHLRRFKPTANGPPYG